VYLRLKREIRDRGVILRSPNFEFVENDLAGLLELIGAWTAEKERVDNKRQVIDKQKSRLLRGYWPFPAPHGYNRVEDAIHGRHLVTDPDKALIIKDAFELYANDVLATQAEVTKFMSKRYKLAGINTRVHKSTVSYILNNMLYTGYIEFPKWKVERVKGHHEAIITMEIYEQVKSKLQRQAKNPKARDYNSDFPLKKGVVCSNCGHNLTGSWNKGRTKKYPNYSCLQEGCSMRYKSIPKGQIEGEFEAILREYKLAAELVDLTQAIFEDVWSEKLAGREKERLQLQLVVNQLNAKINDCAEKIVKIQTDTVVRVLEEKIVNWEAEKREVELALGQLADKYSDKSFGIMLTKVLSFMESPLQSWTEGDLQTKQDILDMFFMEKLSYDRNKGFGTIKYALPAQVILGTQEIIDSGKVTGAQNCNKVEP
jgi:hypothetical protein